MSSEAAAPQAAGDVCFHSDDLGVSLRVNDAILSAWEAGDLDGFSILANGVGQDEIARRLAAAPERPARISVHLNLSECACTAPREKIPLLVDAGGVFRHSFGSLLWLWLRTSHRRRAELKSQIELEFNAQIAAVQALCTPRSVCQLDGHIHIHMLPFTFPVAIRCARAAGVPGIRVSRESFYLSDPWRDGLRPFFMLNLVKHFLLRLLSVRARVLAEAGGLQSPARLVGVLYTGHMTARRALDGIAAARRRIAGPLEVVFHVGRAMPDEAGRWAHAPAQGLFYLAPQRAVEQAEIKLVKDGIRGGSTPRT